MSLIPFHPPVFVDEPSEADVQRALASAPDVAALRADHEAHQVFGLRQRFLAMLVEELSVGEQRWAPACLVIHLAANSSKHWIALDKNPTTHDDMIKHRTVPVQARAFIKALGKHRGGMMATQRDTVPKLLRSFPGWCNPVAYSDLSRLRAVAQALLIAPEAVYRGPADEEALLETVGWPNRLLVRPDVEKALKDVRKTESSLHLAGGSSALAALPFDAALARSLRQRFLVMLVQALEKSPGLDGSIHLDLAYGTSSTAWVRLEATVEAHEKRLKLRHPDDACFMDALAKPRTILNGARSETRQMLAYLFPGWTHAPHISYTPGELLALSQTLLCQPEARLDLEDVAAWKEFRLGQVLPAAVPGARPRL